jgi:D-alanyl-D-alanine carboxypeptidase
LDRDRETRLAALEAREKADQSAEDAARLRASRYGGKGEFINALNRKAGELDLGDRMRRGTRGLERDGDD